VDPMEIMMEMTDFRRLKLKTKQERILYSSLLRYVSRKTSSLISLTDLADSQLKVLHSLHSSLDTTYVPFNSSTLPRVMYLTLSKCFMSLKILQNAENNTRNMYRPTAAYFYLIRINYIIL